MWVPLKTTSLQRRVSTSSSLSHILTKNIPLRQTYRAWAQSYVTPILHDEIPQNLWENPRANCEYDRASSTAIANHLRILTSIYSTLWLRRDIPSMGTIIIYGTRFEDSFQPDCATIRFCYYRGIRRTPILCFLRCIRVSPQQVRYYIALSNNLVIYKMSIGCRFEWEESLLKALCEGKVATDVWYSP